MRGSFCGGNEDGKVYSGTYGLISVLNNASISSVMHVGERVFTEGLIDGIEEFSVPGNERLIALYQYRSCNGDEVEFYRVDNRGRLNKVRFHNKDGSKEVRVGTGPNRGPDEVSGDQLTFCSFNNAMPATFCDSYTYDGQNFIQTAGILHQGSKNEERIVLEARRALFEFLNNLNEGKYKIAAFYYVGPDDVVKNNPNIPTDDRGELFERYCTKDGGACLMPEGLQLKSADPSGELKFEVSFVGRGLSTAIIHRKPPFEFRVKRMATDFKVLDLPPYSSLSPR